MWFRILVLAAVLLNAGIDWYFTFDLTQIGGMAFGSIALIWLVYTVCIERRREQESPWEEFFAEMEQREEEFLYDENAVDENTFSDPPNEMYARKETPDGIRRKDPYYDPGNEQEDTTRVLAVRQEKPVFILTTYLLKGSNLYMTYSAASAKTHFQSSVFCLWRDSFTQKTG